jgi:hypothetical protein
VVLVVVPGRVPPAGDQLNVAPGGVEDLTDEQLQGAIWDDTTAGLEAYGQPPGAAATAPRTLTGRVSGTTRPCQGRRHRIGAWGPPPPAQCQAVCLPANDLARTTSARPAPPTSPIPSVGRHKSSGDVTFDRHCLQDIVCIALPNLALRGQGRRLRRRHRPSGLRAALGAPSSAAGAVTAAGSPCCLRSTNSQLKPSETKAASALVSDTSAPPQRSRNMVAADGHSTRTRAIRPHRLGRAGSHALAAITSSR